MVDEPVERAETDILFLDKFIKRIDVNTLVTGQGMLETKKQCSAHILLLKHGMRVSDISLTYESVFGLDTKDERTTKTISSSSNPHKRHLRFSANTGTLLIERTSSLQDNTK